MPELTSAHLHDLSYALSRYGVIVDEVPRDHEGKTITDRLRALVEDGESYRYSSFSIHDLRRDDRVLWELFPENPVSAAARDELMDDVSELLREEAEHHASDNDPLVKRSQLPTSEHVAYMDEVIAYAGGSGDVPGARDSHMWNGVEIFDDILMVTPRVRQAEALVQQRAALIEELSTGVVPAASAVIVRQALDVEEFGLRNADITLAAWRIQLAALTERLITARQALADHVEVADRLRKARDDMNALDDTLHWPGDWRSAPRRAPSLQSAGQGRR